MDVEVGPRLWSKSVKFCKGDCVYTLTPSDYISNMGHLSIARRTSRAGQLSWRWTAAEPTSMADQVEDGLMWVRLA